MLDAVTIRYAEALFDLATRNGALDVVHSDVSRLETEFDVEAVRTFFLDGRVSKEARLSKLDPLLSGMHELTRNFVGLLFDKHREAVLPQLGAAFRARFLRERGAAEGFIESARPLEESAVRSLEKALTQRLGKTVTLTARLSPELLGGARVIVESQMIDFSLQGRIESLRKRMLGAPIGSAAQA